MCQTYTDGRDSEAICRRTLATMFAHFTQETGGHNPNGEVEEWRQGLVYLREAGCQAGVTINPIIPEKIGVLIQ